MKKLLYILIGLGLGFASIAYAANVSVPQSTQLGDLVTGKANGNYQLLHPGANNLFLMASSTSPNGLVWASTSAAGSGITSLNGQVGTVQTFATSTSGGIDLFITSSSNVHTFTVQPTSGYNIPLTASTTNWNNFYNTPSGRITAGNNLSWSGNTLNGTMASSTIIAGGTATHSPSITFATTTDTNLLLSIFCNTATCTFTPGWTGTLADGRIASAATWNAKQNALTFPLAVNLGGTGSSSLNTTLVSEGTNLYYTDARARGSVSASASPITYDSSTGKIGFTNPGYITGNQTITFSGDVTGSGTTAITTSYNNIVPISKGGTATSTAPTASAVLLGNGTNYDYSVIPSCSNTTTSKLLYNNSTRTFSCGTDQTGSGGGATTTITSNVQTDGPNFIFATGTATGIGLNVSGSGSAITFTPTVSTNYSIPLTASTTQWSTLVNSPTWIVGNGKIYNATSTDTILIGTSTPFTTGVGAFTPLYISASTTNYLQLVIQNTSRSATSSADVSLHADIGTDSTYYGNVGINGSNYSQTGFSGQAAFDTYLMGSDGAVILSAATTSSAGVIKFFTGGNDRAQERLRVTNAGYIGIGSTTPTALLTVQGTSTAPTLPLFTVASSTSAPLFRVASNGSTTLSSLGTGVVQSSSGGLYNASVALGSQVSGTLRVANGGTGATSFTTGFGLRGAGTAALASGKLIDNGTVIGTNATSSTVTVNLQASAGLTPLIVASSTGTALLTVAGNGSTTISSLATAGLVRSTATGSLYVDSATYLTAALTSLNGLTGATQTFATTTGGTVWSITSSGTAHTWNIPATPTFTGINLTNASTTNLTVSGATYLQGYTFTNASGTALTLSNNLWVSGQTNLGNASTTNFSASGNIYDKNNVQVLGGMPARFSMASTTLSPYDGSSFSSGTSTVEIAGLPYPYKINVVYGNTTAAGTSGTAKIICGNGTASTTTLSLTSSVASTTASVLFNAFQAAKCQIGSASSNPFGVSIGVSQIPQ